MLFGTTLIHMMWVLFVFTCAPVNYKRHNSVNNVKENMKYINSAEKCIKKHRKKARGWRDRERGKTDEEKQSTAKEKQS